MTYLKKTKKIGAYLLVVFLVTACTTQKKRGDLTKFQKFYQNTTSEYNGYFNANILYEESLLKMKH